MPLDEEFEEWEDPGNCNSDENFSALGSSSTEKALVKVPLTEGPINIIVIKP